MRSADGAGLVAWSLTEVNGRPLSLFAKEAEAVERLQATVGCREVNNLLTAYDCLLLIHCVLTAYFSVKVSVVVQPADFVVRVRKQMKGSVRGYKDFLLN